MDLLPGSARIAKTAHPGVNAVFRRTRLLRELADNRSAACTWVEGPPGSGKTSLLASLAHEHLAPVVWYQVDADDGDAPAFFACMASAVRLAVGDAARELPTFTPESGFSLASFARRFFGHVFALAPGLTLVLDDYHQAPADGSLHDLVRVAIEQTPPQAHIAVASRTPPPRVLARLQAHGALRSISWAQLMLNTDEVLGIAALHGVPLDAAGALQWHGRCGGWAAGLRLLLWSSASPGLRVAPLQSPDLLLDYLGQEVFGKLPQTDQSLLLQLAFMPSMPADALAALTGSARAERQLAALARQNLFTTVSGDKPPTYRFHPLLREFLMHRALTELPEDEVLSRCHAAADVLRGSGLVEDGAQVLIEAKSWQRLEQWILAEAPRCMAQGRYKTVDQWLAALPPQRVEHDPWLLYWQGASRAPLDPQTARAWLETAYEHFEQQQQPAGMLLAWSGVVDCIFYTYFDLTQFDVWIERLDRMLASGLAFPSPEIEARVSLSMFVALAFRQPQHAQFAAWRQRLQGLAGVSPDPMFRLQARQHLLVSRIWSGDLHGANAAMADLKREVAERPVAPFIELVRHLSDATLALYTGEVEACFDAIEKALAVAQGSGIHLWDKVLLGQGAALALSHGQAERGREFARRRAGTMRVGDVEEQSFHHALEAWSCWLDGQRPAALSHVELALDAGHRMGLPHFEAVAELAMSIVSFECGDEAGALQQLRAGRAIGAKTHNPMIEWFADLLEAHMRLQRGEPAAALVARAMTAGRRHGYRHFFFWPRHAVAQVCLEALAQGIEVDYVRQLIAKGRLPAPPDAAASDLWPRPVNIYTLGRFLIVVDGKPLQFEGKAQRMPMNLLQAIVADGGRAVAESRVIDALWPDAEGGAGEQALATTLSRLRKLVGTDTVTRQSGYLALDRGRCWVDSWALERVLERQQDVDPGVLLGHVRRLFRGEFLHGESAAPWLLRPRERMRVALVKALCRAGEAALGHRRSGLAAELFEFGLSVDELVEAFYAGLLRCHAMDRQPGLAAGTYRRCRRVLLEHLGVMPADSTTRLYRATVGGAGQG